jgi:hypothetical protein
LIVQTALATNSRLKEDMKPQIQTAAITKVLLLILITAISIALMGCKSEVDKCVEALVKINPNDPSQEGKARLYCLRAQAGKE